MTPAERFWTKVQRGEPDACWMWTAYRNNCGYGVIGFDGRNQKAHRIAWILTNGAPPPGLRVLHRCDNPPCCNPDHLFLGTQLDNIADRHAKGRTRVGFGSRHGSAKLNEAMVTAIRQRLASGATRAAVAAEFGVSRDAVRSAVTGWKHVGGMS